MYRLCHVRLADALYFLGLLHLYGIGMAQDTSRAVQHMRTAAELGLVEAQTAVASLLLAHSPSADPNSAVAYLRSAVNAGHLEATWLLGRCYCEGRGTEHSYSEAVNWFQQ
jgi:TPR repeat protein